MKTIPFTILLTLLSLTLLPGCATVKPEGDTVEEKRAYVEESMSRLMEAFVRREPALQEKIDSSVGYAIFRYRSSKLPTLLSGIGGGRGFGLARDMETGRLTYMKLQKAQWGVGMGTRDLGVLFVFTDRSVFEKFITGKWDSGGGIEATARGGELGGGSGSSVSIKSGFTVYQITESGISYGATWQTRRFSPDKGLN